MTNKRRIEYELLVEAGLLEAKLMSIWSSIARISSVNTAELALARELHYLDQAAYHRKVAANWRAHADAEARA